MWGGNLSHRSVHFYHTYTKNKRRGAESGKKQRGSAARKEGAITMVFIFMSVSVIFRWLSSTAICNALYNLGSPIHHDNKTTFPWKRPSKTGCLLIKFLSSNSTCHHRKQQLTVCFQDMLIETE